MASVKKFQVRLPPDVSDMLDSLSDSRKMSLNTVVVELIRFAHGQDELVQLMALGQIKPTPDLIRLALRRLSEQQADEGQEYRRAAKPRED